MFGRACAVAAAIVLLQVFVSPAAAEDAPPPERFATTRDRTPKPIPRLEGFRLDGVLDEPAWEQALRIELPWEVNPGDNIEARVRTEAFLAYDDGRLYAAFRAHDPDPSRIRARLSDRDRAFQDDFVGLVVDTFNDERRAFEFFVNPVGVQMDLVQDDVNGSEDSSWDAIWDSAGRITEQGYEVELSIPYTSLRFQRGSGTQVWGLDLIRIYPREQRFQFTSNPRDRNVSCYLCQIDKVVGFEGAEPGKNLEITPTLTAGRTDTNPAFPDSGLDTGDVESELGLTARWGVTPNLTLSGTANPDFSQVEADVARLDVNEQFALFFPEKRPFFLEGGDFFETLMNAFYTRTVAVPEWGVKLTGKEGANALGAFAARDDPGSDVTLLLPGSQGSRFAVLEDEFDVGVLRYRRDLGKNSALGALLTSREGDVYHNRVFGVDGLARATDQDTLRVQLLRSQTEYPQAIVNDLGQPAGEFEDDAWALSYRHSTRNWTVRANLEDVGRDFRADLGFMPQVDFKRAILGGWRTWWQEPGKKWAWFEIGGDWDQTEDQNGQLIERETEASFLASGPRQLFFIVGGGHRERVFEQIEFSQNFVNTFVELHPTRDLYVGLGANFSHRVDFAYRPGPGDPAARQGKEYRLSPELRYNFGRHLRLDLSHNYLALDGDDGKLFEANLTELRLVHQFNVRMFVRAIVQLRDVEHDTTQYPLCNIDPPPDPLPFPCSRPEARNLFGQFLFSYKVNPQTALFFGFTENRDAVQDTSLVTTDRTLFLKLGYAWVQ